MSDDIDYGLYYRTWHDESDEHAEHMIQFAINEVREYLLPDLDAPLLEIGCGMGFAMMALQRRGYTAVTGVDRDRSQVEACLARGLSVERVDNLIAWLEARPGCFAQVLMLDVLEHIPVDQQIPVARAISKTLRPGGRAIFKTPNANSLLASRWRYNDFTHASSFTEHSIRFVLLSAGFKSVAVPPIGQPGGRPTLRIWQWNHAYRQDMARWFLRLLWRKVLELELHADASKIPLGLDLVAIADL